MDLGEYYPCLNVQDLQQSIDFYRKLDFKLIEDHRSENWAVLQHNNMVQMFPSSIVAGMSGFNLKELFEVFDPEVREAPKVQF